MPVQLKRQLSGLKQLLRLIRGQEIYASVLFGVMLMAALAEGFGLSLVLPLLSGLIGLEMDAPLFSGILDRLLTLVSDAHKLEGLLAILVLAFTVKSALMVLQTGMTTHYALRLRASWANGVFRNYLQAPYQRVSEQPHGTLVHNTITESLNASRAVTMLLQLLSKVIVSVTLFMLLIYSDAMIVIAIAAGAGVIIYGLWNVTHRYARRFGKERLLLSQKTTGAATEGLSAIREVKIYGLTDNHEQGLRDKLDRFTRITTKFKIFTRLPGDLGELVVIVFISLLLLVVQLTRSISVQEFIPLLGFFVLISQRLLANVSFIISQRMKIISVIPSVVLMKSLVNGASLESDGGGTRSLQFTKLKGDINISNVQFSYDNGKRVFRNLNMVIPFGKMVGLIGPSGSGKSTVADLLLCLVSPQGGQIAVNGKNLGEWNLESWRRKVGYVSQDIFIFNASIRDNILLGRPEGSMDDVLKAAQMANVHEFVQELPEGYDTLVGDRGVKLSGGQKQRVAIARAIIRDPDLYIFDEATSSLDQESERLIQESIDKLSHSKTSLVIAHRLSTLQSADVVYELSEDGFAMVVTPFQREVRGLG